MATASAQAQNALAILPGAPQAEINLEGPKTHRPVVLRRTIDPSGPFVNLLQTRFHARTAADASAMQPTPTGALGILPPEGYLHQPASSFNTNFVHALLNKSKTTINTIVWMPGGRRVFTGAHSGEFTLWSGSNFAFESVLQAHEAPVRAMTYSHNANWLLSGDDTGVLRIWKPNLQLMKHEAAHREGICAITFASSDFKYATASADSTIKVWDFATAKTEQVMTGHGGDVKSAHWHSQRALLASGSKDGLVKMWDVKSGSCLTTLHGHKGPLSTVQWNDNGNWLLTASRDATCKVFELRMQKEMGTFKGQGRDVMCAAWHPIHEELFASGGFDGSLLYWLASRPQPQAEVRGAHEGNVTALAWHPAGHLLASGSNDHMMRFWARGRAGDAPDHLQRELRAATVQEGEAPKTRQVPTVQPGAAFIPGIGDAVAFAPTPIPDGIQLERPGSAGQQPTPTPPLPLPPQAHHHSRLQWHTRSDSPAQGPQGLKRPHSSAFAPQRTASPGSQHPPSASGQYGSAPQPRLGPAAAVRPGPPPPPPMRRPGSQPGGSGSGNLPPPPTLAPPLRLPTPPTLQPPPGVAPQARGRGRGRGRQDGRM